MIDLSISIVSNSNRELLRECLYSIFENTAGISFHVYVLDNASIDGSADMVRVSFPQTTLIGKQTQAGFAANQNEVLRWCRNTSRYTLLLNDDTIVTGGALRALVEFMDSRPGVAAASPKLISPQGTIQVGYGTFPSIWLDIIRHWNLKRLLPGAPVRHFVVSQLAWLCGSHITAYFRAIDEPDSARPVDAVFGTAMILRREALAEVGLLDERYEMYYEDTDWCRMAKSKGWDIWYVPSAKVIHYGSHSKGVFSMVEYERSMYAYFRKYAAGEAEVSALKLATFPAILCRWLWHFLAHLIGRREVDRSYAEALWNIMSVTLRG